MGYCCYCCCCQNLPKAPEDDTKKRYIKVVDEFMKTVTELMIALFQLESGTPQPANRSGVSFTGQVPPASMCRMVTAAKAFDVGPVNI